MELSFILLLIAHWQACFWALVPIFIVADGTPTWITAYIEKHQELSINGERLPVYGGSSAFCYSRIHLLAP